MLAHSFPGIACVTQAKLFAARGLSSLYNEYELSSTLREADWTDGGPRTKLED